MLKNAADDLAILEISDGTDTINLLASHHGFGLRKWEPNEPSPKGDGLFGSSPFNDGRVPLQFVDDNIIDQFELFCVMGNSDRLFEKVAELRMLLRKARAYWTSEIENQPVWIKAQSKCETNPRYSTISDYRLPKQMNPYESIGVDGAEADVDLVLTLEHQYWQAQQPGTQDCVPLTDQHTVTNLWLSGFNGVNASINLGSAASIDDLTANDFCVDGWIKPHTFGADGNIWCKTGGGVKGWHVHFDTATGSLVARSYFSVTNGLSVGSVPGINLLDGQLHHYAVEWSIFDNKWRIWIDGIECIYTTQTAAVGVLVTDAAENLLIGAKTPASAFYDGVMGWQRLMTGVHFTAAWWTDFIANYDLYQCTLPAIDATTLGVWVYQFDPINFLNYVNPAVLPGTGANIQAELNDPCLRTVGEVDTCELIPISSYYSKIEITDVVHYDASLAVYSNNVQLGAMPANLTPAVPAAGDWLYIGSTILWDAANDSPYGPFQNFVCKFTTAQHLNLFAAEYWNGAWTGFLGLVRAVETDLGGGRFLYAFLPPADWTTTAVNGVTGWWIRFDVGAGNLVTVSQALYCANKPFVDIQAKDVKGNIDALATIEYQDLITYSAYASKRVQIGLVSDEFISDFIPSFGVSRQIIGKFYPGFFSTFPAVISSPTYPDGGGQECLNITPGNTDDLHIYINGLGGKVRVWMETLLTVGARGDIQAYINNLDSPANRTSFFFPDITNFNVLPGDVLILTSGWVTVLPTTSKDLYLNVLNTAGGNRTLDVIGMAFMPIEEWTGEYNNDMSTDVSLIIDTSKPKYPKLVKIYNITNGEYSEGNGSSIVPSILHANKLQRLCFLTWDTTTSMYSRFSGGVKLRKTERYLSMRGSQ